MTLSHFFIDRPIFATVLSIVIVVAGAIAYFTLPVAQYPEVVPPTVVVRASYPGANPGSHRRHGGYAAGTADQWRRGHALYVVAIHD